MTSLSEGLASYLAAPGFIPFYPLAVVGGLLVAYLLGSTPVALIIGRITAGIDIREHGSGNPGFTNALRTLGWGPGIVVLLLDMLKGALGGLVMAGLLLIVRDLMVDEYLIAQTAGSAAATSSESLISSLANGFTGFLHDLPCALALLASVLGHMFSPFMGFKGGKGIATGFGGMLVLIPTVALLAFSLFLLLAFTTRIVSIGSLVAAFSLPFLTLWLMPDSPTYLVFTALTGLVIIYAHRKNISRLLKGTETRFNVGRKKES